jgi:hypothetical protein
MKFFICDDGNKFTKKTLCDTYGKWVFFHDDKVSVYKGKDFIVLYSGYLIEGDIEEVASDFSFHEANGNFFAVKLTKTDYEISIDYFQNHKIFTADKYGIEITNYLPYMTIKEEDIVRKEIQYDYNQRELTPREGLTFFGHIQSFLPVYNYLQDCKDAFRQEVWNPDELTDYIHECMTQHSQLIKDNYKNRFISLSEGIDSAVQSQYFKDDPQYVYTVSPCDAGKEGLEYKQIAAKNFPNSILWTYECKKNIEYTHRFLRDSSTRWCAILPTMIQIEEANPDIVLYGVNGDEMFFRDLFPHLHLLHLKYYSKSKGYIENKIMEDMENKRNHYGACYSLGRRGKKIKHTDQTSFDFFKYSTTDSSLNYYINNWLTSEKDYGKIEFDMLHLITPKLYTRSISCNNDVLTASLYNDRRIYHEVFKINNKWLEENAMDSPIQRNILKKFDYEFVTPHKDVLSANYSDIYENIFNATVPHCMEQNI